MRVKRIKSIADMEVYTKGTPWTGEGVCLTHTLTHTLSYIRTLIPNTHLSTHVHLEILYFGTVLLLVHRPKVFVCCGHTNAQC